MGSSSLLPMGFTPRVRSTARLSERDKGVEHFRVRTIGFPDQGVWIMPQIDHTGFAVAAARAILPDLVKPHPANAPAGSNRSSHGGDEMAEAFGVAGHIGH